MSESVTNKRPKVARFVPTPKESANPSKYDYRISVHTDDEEPTPFAQAWSTVLGLPNVPHITQPGRAATEPHYHIHAPPTYGPPGSNWYSGLIRSPFSVTEVADFSVRAKSQVATAKRFNKLLAEWKVSRDPFASDMSNMMLPAYQQLIGLGPDGLPLIFRELESNLDDWFWALKSITGEDPVPDEHLGDFEAMRKDWLQWAAMNGYQWQD